MNEANQLNALQWSAMPMTMFGLFAFFSFSIFYFVFDNSILLWTVHAMRPILCDLLQDDSTNSLNDIALASIESMSTYKLTTKLLINFIHSVAVRSQCIAGPVKIRFFISI